MNSTSVHHDAFAYGTIDPVVIVGGGPIGIEIAVALTRRGIANTIIEAGSVGHTISWWAPQTRWFSSNERIAIAGVPLVTVDGSKATREEYLAYLRGVVRQFDLSIATHTIATDVTPQPGGGLAVRLRTTAGNRTIDASAVVLAIGGTDHPRRIDIPGTDRPHVDGYLREVHRYFGRRVLVVGGRNSAIEAALRLYHVGADVTLSYRGEELPEDHIKYWLLPEIKGLMKVGKIRGEFGTNPVEILDSTVRLQRGEDTFLVDADDVLLLIGYEQDKGLLRRSGVNLIESMQRPRHDPETMMTDIDGVYVAGTAVAGTQSSKYKTFLENCHVHVDRIVNHLDARLSRSSRDNPPGTLDRRSPEPPADSARDTFEKLIQIQPES